MHIRTFRNGDETALRAIFHSSVHALACKDYTAEQLEAWSPRQYEAAQWGERVRGSQPWHHPTVCRRQSDGRAVFQEEWLCGRGASAGGGARRRSGKRADVQGIARSLLLI